MNNKNTYPINCKWYRMNQYHSRTVNNLEEANSLYKELLADPEVEKYYLSWKLEDGTPMGKTYPCSKNPEKPTLIKTDKFRSTSETPNFQTHPKVSKKFKVGQELETRSICDSDCIFTGKVLKRTEKTVTISSPGEKNRRCKVHQSWNGDGEFIYPFGRFSMAPIFKA